MNIVLWDHQTVNNWFFAEDLEKEMGNRTNDIG